MELRLNFIRPRIKKTRNKYGFGCQVIAIRRKKKVADISNAFGMEKHVHQIDFIVLDNVIFETHKNKEIYTITIFIDFKN